MIPDLEPRRARISAGELAYADIGEGPPVVLLHGFPTSSFLWRREAWLLSQGMRVIAPDLLGYGRSDKPPGADLSERAQAGYLRELLEGLGLDEVALVGHDIGGSVALLFSLEAGAKVRALVLLDTPCFDAWPIEGVKLLQGATPEQETAEFVGDVVRMTLDLGRARDRDEEVVQRLLEPWLADPAAFFRAARGITGKGLAGREDELAQLEAPTFILWGEEDPFLPPALGERLQEAMPSSTLALLPGCAHFVTEDAPGTVGPLIYQYLRSRLADHRPAEAADGPVPVFLERPTDPAALEPRLDPEEA